MNTRLFLLMILCSGLYLPAKTQNCLPPTSQTALDVNNVSALMLNGGDMWWDFSYSKYEVPKGSGKTAFFTHSLWLAATDGDGQVHCAAQRFRSVGNDYWPGPIFEDANGLQYTECLEFDRHWSVTKEEIDDFIAGTLSQTPEAIKNWPAKGNPNFSMNLTQDLAPFYDVNGDGLYDSDSGDYPAIKGDQSVFWILNDIGNLHTETGGQQLKFEIHVMAYAYQTSDVVNNTTFYDYTVINKSNIDYEDFRLGFFTDSDLGNAQDDFIGCDSTRHLGYTYNGDPFDEDNGGNLGYGADLPIVGLRMVNLPKDESGEDLGMARFGYFNNGAGPTGDPSTAADYLNYMSGKWKDGSNWTTGGFGSGGTTPVNYVFPGNPGDTSTWSECSVGNIPGDRRMIASHGPMTFPSGFAVSFTEAAIFSQEEDYKGACTDISVFLNETDLVNEFGQSNKCENFDVSISANITNTDGSDGALELNLNGTNGDYQYEWSNGGESKDQFNLSQGVYTVTVSNHFGCSESASFSVSPIGIEDIPQLQVQLTPNPSKDGIFQIRSNGGMLDIETYNLLGDLVDRQSSLSTLNLSVLQSGVYVVRTNSSFGSITQKVILQ